MVDRKPYKTRLCMLYQRGRCSRQHCNFAHGGADLRRSFNGRQEYRGRDLRESLGRKHSPLRAYSPRRDTKARLSSHGHSPSSPGQRINHRKRCKLDGHHGLKKSDWTEDHDRERRQTPSNSKVLLDEQRRQVQTEIKMLDNDRRQLEVFLEEKAQEADTLTLKIHQLEVQLSKEKEEVKRITSKIKKFIKAHNRHLRLQEELKRSYAQVQRLGEELDLDAARPGANEEDLKINTVSEEETGVNNVSSLNEYHINPSPSKKRATVCPEVNDASNQVKGDKSRIGKERPEKLSGQTGHHELLHISQKPDVDSGANNIRGHLPHEDNRRSGIYRPSDISSAEMVPESNHALPSTGLAAHTVDEDGEDVETDERFQVTGAASNGAETEITLKLPLLPFPPPPPPPVHQNAYSQYEGNDEHVDIDELDDEAVEVDIV